MAKLFLGNREISPVLKTKDIESLNINPTTSVQVIEASNGGYNPINVAAVTAAIDSNIISSNIRKGISILGVEGNVEVTEGLHRDISSQGKLQMPSTNFSFSLPNNAIDIVNYGMHCAFTGCTGLTSVNLSSLTTISGSEGMSYAFSNCTGLTALDLSSLTIISGSNGMHYAFQGTSLTSLDLSALTNISGSNGMQSAFQSCKNLASVDLSSLTTISGNRGMDSAFSSCTGLTSVNLSSLTTISSSYGMYDTFYYCKNLASVDLSSLTTVGEYGLNNTFYGCTGLISVDLSGLISIGSYGLRYAFRGCTSLTSLSFPSLRSTSFGSYTNQFNNMLLGVTSCTVHFPSNLQSVIGSWSDVTAGFGGTNTTVLYDLPATS